MPTSIQRNVKRQNRLTSNFKVLEEGLFDQTVDNTICQNCKSRHDLVALRTDNKNLRCNHCGALTPIRSIKHGRGLAAPAIQLQETGIAQPKTAMGKSRLPEGIHSNKQKNPFEEQLISKGFQIIDSQYIEPAAQEY